MRYTYKINKIPSTRRDVEMLLGNMVLRWFEESVSSSANLKLKRKYNLDIIEIKQIEVIK